MSGTAWTQQQEVISPSAAAFGASVALGGGTAAVGSSGQQGEEGNSITVYAVSGGSLGGPQAISPTVSQPGDGFGDALAIDGVTLVVGAPDTSHGAGAAFVFDLGSSAGDACTSGDACASGYCVDGVCCTARVVPAGGRPCNAAETCQPGTGMCSVTPLGEGMACDQDDLCMIGGTCQGGMCSGGSVLCAPPDDCHEFGACDPATGTCSNPEKADGQPCAGGVCLGGVCVAGPDGGLGGGGGGGGGGRQQHRRPERLRLRGGQRRWRGRYARGGAGAPGSYRASPPGEATMRAGAHRELVRRCSSGPSRPVRASHPLSVSAGRDDGLPGKLEVVGLRSPAGERGSLLHTPGLRADFTAHGVTVGPTRGAAWRFQATPRAFGCDGALAALGEALPKVQGGRVEYARPELREWYVESPRRPRARLHARGTRRGAARRGVVIAIDGGLSALVSADGRAARLHDASGRRVLRYTDLHVLDAAGRELAARLEAQGEGLSIRFDDDGARYPVTVDPIDVGGAARARRERRLRGRRLRRTRWR